jgi:outer membrane protein assembly factor BamD (BamD/ComL family)
MTFFPDDRRVTNAQKAIVLLKAEQVRGNFEIAQFYEKSHILGGDQKRRGALVYYNEVLQLDPNSRYAAQARQRVEILKSRLQNSPAS